MFPHQQHRARLYPTPGDISHATVCVYCDQTGHFDHRTPPFGTSHEQRRFLRLDRSISANPCSDQACAMGIHTLGDSNIVADSE